MKKISVLLIPITVTLILEFFFKLCNGGIYTILITKIPSLFISILLGIILYIVLLGIFKESNKINKFYCRFMFILFLINKIKIIYTGEPIYFSDINFVSKTIELGSLVSSTVLKMLLPYANILLAMPVIFYLIIQLNKKRNIEITNMKTRIILVSSAALVIGALFIPNKHTQNFYLNTFYRMNKYVDYNSWTTNLSYYLYHSMLSGMYGVMLNNRLYEPENYDISTLKQELSELQMSEMDKWEKANIICISAESFWDVSKISGIEFDREITKNFNDLKEKGKGVELLTNVYGGMSENTVFELITGGSMNYFPKGYIPIMSLYKKAGSNKIPSIVHDLNNNGYDTKIIFGKDYYNSEDTYRKIGFKEYIELKPTEENQKGYYISDEYLTDVVIEYLKNKKKNQKSFYFISTIQNHMPYEIDKYKDYDMKIKNSQYTKEINETILSYAQGVYDIDKQLGRLYDFIIEYEEPTIIIFLSDHLPYLYTDQGKNALFSFEYFDTGNEIENTYRKYNTQALIFANYGVDYSNIPDLTSNDLFLTTIVNQMDLKINDYYRWLYTTFETLPASNKFVSVSGNGRVYNTNHLDDEMKRVYELKKHMQYKFFVDTDKN